MKIEPQLMAEIEGMGFTVLSLHYGDEKGSNELEDVKVLVLLGLPIPSIDEFKEKAQAFLCDQGDLDLERKPLDQ